MGADVLRECGILINTNLLLKREKFDGEFRDFLRKIQSRAHVRRADQAVTQYPISCGQLCQVRA
jgi:hypothetical protein